MSEPKTYADGLRDGMERAAKIADRKVAPLRADSQFGHISSHETARQIAAAIRQAAGEVTGG